MTKVLSLHGINHNMFGKRDPAQYGENHAAKTSTTPPKSSAGSSGVEVENFQTNDEGAICLKIHQAYEEKVDAVMINAGAWTHYSIGFARRVGHPDRAYRGNSYVERACTLRDFAITL